MSAEKQKRSRSVAFTPDASDYDTSFSDFMEVACSEADDDVMLTSTSTSVKYSLETTRGKTPKKKGPGYLSKLHEKFRRSKTSESSSPKSPNCLLSPDDCVTKGTKYSSKLSRALSGSIDRRVSAPVATLVHELHFKTETEVSTKHIHERHSSSVVSPVCIFVSSTGEKQEEEVVVGLRQQRRAFGSTGNILANNMSENVRRTNLTKTQLGKSLQQVSHTKILCC